jgi:hypothetical protein
MVLSATPWAQESTAGQYRALVARYRSVDTRGAVQALSDQDDRWVTDAVSAVLKQPETWTTSDAQAAALLHTEAVVGGWVLPQHAPTHLAAARRFVELNRGRTVPPAFRRQWLLLVSWFYQADLDFGAVVPWLDELRAIGPDDPEFALAEATFYETLVWTGAPPPDFTWNGRSRTLAPIASRSRDEILARASERFRVAAASPATHDAASVHLGRVLTAIGRWNEARDVLRPLTSDAGERRWRYLAALFLAQAESGARRYDAATAAYETATTMMPECQTPQLGVMTLRRLQGDAIGAGDLAATILKGGTGVCDDPWWFYRFGQPPDRSPELLAAMREPLLH